MYTHRRKGPAMELDDTREKGRSGADGAEAGQTLTEVALVLAFVAAVCIVFLVLLGVPIVGYFQAAVDGFA